MSEHDELVKRLSKWLPALVLQEVAQAIERLEREKADLERRATFIEHDHPQKLEPHFSEAMGLLTTRKAFRKSEIAQLLAEQMQQLAEARAREDDRQEAIRAVLKVLPTQREPHPDDDLQKLVNLACSLLDDALTDYAPEALATPAPPQQDDWATFAQQGGVQLKTEETARAEFNEQPPAMHSVILYENDGTPVQIPVLNGFVSRVVSAVFHENHADAQRVAAILNQYGGGQ